MFEWEFMVTDVISSVGHLRSDSVGLLMIEGSLHIRGIGVVLQVPWDSANSIGNGFISWVDHMVLSYDMIRLIRTYIISILHL
jgi:hypothetical protein